MGESALTLAMLVVLTVSVIGIIPSYFYCKPPEFRCVTVVVPSGNPETLEAVLKYVYRSMQSDFKGYGELCFLIDEANEEEIMIANAFCSDNAGIVLTDTKNLRAILGDSVYKTARFVLY